MATVREIQFSSVDGRRAPYISEEEETVYRLDGSGGSITFNGYFYVEDHAPPYPEDAGLEPWLVDRHSEWLPKKLRMDVHLRGKEPYKTEIEEGGMFTRVHYRTIERGAYLIEVYKREKHECTDQISEIDDGGEPLDVCFFPTMRQTIWFRVLEGGLA